VCQIATCFLPLQDYMRVAQVYNQYRITELLLHGVDPSLLLSECAKPSWTLFPNKFSLSLSLSLYCEQQRKERPQAVDFPDLVETHSILREHIL